MIDAAAVGGAVAAIGRSPGGPATLERDRRRRLGDRQERRIGALGVTRAEALLGGKAERGPARIVAARARERIEHERQELVHRLEARWRAGGPELARELRQR